MDNEAQGAQAVRTGWEQETMTPEKKSDVMGRATFRSPNNRYRYPKTKALQRRGPAVADMLRAEGIVPHVLRMGANAPWHWTSTVDPIMSTEAEFWERPVAPREQTDSGADVIATAVDIVQGFLTQMMGDGEWDTEQYARELVQTIQESDKVRIVVV
jgi:hypothetical protein